MKLHTIAFGIVSIFAANLAAARDWVDIDAVASAQDRQLEQQSRIDYATAAIRSNEDLQRFLMSPQSIDSPLNAMSEAGRQRFLGSLRFNEKGLTAFGYADLETELTPTQIYRILKLFGAERDAAFFSRARIETEDDVKIMDMPRSPIDYRDYECAKRATCTQSNFSICTGNC